MAKASLKLNERPLEMRFSFGDHGIKSYLLFKIIVTNECQVVCVCLPPQGVFVQLNRMGGICKKLCNGILEVALHAFALDTDFPHGFKIAVLLVVAAGIVCQFE